MNEHGDDVSRQVSAERPAVFPADPGEGAPMRKDVREGEWEAGHKLPLIERYTPNERSNHWITAITFVLLALSGLSMFHPAMSWLYAIFGGRQWTRTLHSFV